MTENEFLDGYLSLIKKEQKEIKDEIQKYFDENKNDKSISFLLRDKFEGRIRGFEQTYNMSTPKELVGTIYSLISLEKTIEIYLDLARFPNELLSTLED